MSKNQYSIKTIGSSCTIYTEELDFAKKFKNFVAYIPQHYVGYIDSNSNYEIMGTQGLGPCVGITVYNKEYKKEKGQYKVALTHIDDTTTKDSILNVFKNMRNSDEEHLNICFVGGDIESYNYLSPIIKEIEKLPNVSVVKDELFPKGKSPNDLSNSQEISIDKNGFCDTKFSEKKIPFVHKIHGFKSPLISKIYDSSMQGYEFDLESIDFNDNTTLVGELPKKFVPEEFCYGL